MSDDNNTDGKKQIDLTPVFARKEISEDKELTFGARFFGMWLVDAALDPDLNNRKRGQVDASELYLSTRLGADESSIRRWANELVDRRHIWVTRVRRPNTWCMKRYHISKIQAAPAAKQEVAGDGNWGNCRRREDPDQSVRGGAAHFTRLKVSIVDRFGSPVSSKTPLISADNEQSAVRERVRYPLPGEDSQPANEEITRGRAAKSTASTGKLPVGNEENARSGGSPVSDIKESKKELEPVLSKSKGGEDAKRPSPPPINEDESFTRWTEYVSKEHAWKWPKMAKELESELERAQGKERRAAIKRRLKFLNDLKHGGLPPDEPKPAPASKPAAPVEISPEEILTQAMQTVNMSKASGLPPLLTAAHKAALNEAGIEWEVKPPASVTEQPEPPQRRKAGVR